MIHVDRSQVAAPPSLTQDDGAGVIETREAIEFYSDDANLDKKFDFQQYGKPDVKDRLIRLFHGKCAYCESKAVSVHDSDIEHFRPKGAVEINNQRAKPGYYWLAAHWENLFLSCQHCNQKRKHRLDGGGTQSSGKTDKFPVLDEHDRVRHDDLPDNLIDNNNHVDMDRLAELCENEPCLLLDPCKDDPQQHLEFLDDGAVIPANTAQEQVMPLGHNSIEVFGLHRPQLVTDRATELVKLNVAIMMVQQFAQLLDNDPTNAQLQQMLTDAIIGLEVHCDPNQRFSGMARQIVDRFKADELGL